MEVIKNIKKNTIIIVIMTIIVLFVVLRKDFNTIVNDLQTMDLKYILIAVLLYILYLVLHSYVVYLTVNKKEKFSFLESVKHKIIVQFFNGITPFSTGGQPMEIYMLKEHDINLSKASNYIIQNFVFYQIALVLFGALAVFINFTFKLFPKVSLLRDLVFLGFFINTMVAVILLFISFSKSITKSFIHYMVNILYKIHLIQDKEKQLEVWDKRVDEFHECASELKKRKSLFVIGVLFNFLGLLCLYSIPLFILYALHDFNSMNLVNTACSSAYVMVVGSFVPIPGASGGIEYSFTQFFGNFLPKTKVNTVLLVWRFITYYLGMIIGAVLFNLDKPKNK